MKLPITKDWLEKRATAEGDLEIGAGNRGLPPAYGGCRCECHRSHMLHIVPCCKPTTPDEIRQSAAVLAKIQCGPPCPACGGSGRMGPFFPGGLSTVCGNCTPIEAKGASDD